MAISESEVVTGEGRLSYVQFPDEKTGKYKMAFLLPKIDTETYEAIEKAIGAARDAFNAGRPKKIQLASPVHDGDGERPKGGEYGPECAGCYVINVATQNEPRLFPAGTIALSDIKSGDYARIKIKFYPFEKEGNRGIAAGLQALNFTRVGEPLVSIAEASDFGIEEERLPL